MKACTEGREARIFGAIGAVLLSVGLLSGCASVKAEGPLLMDWKVETSNAYVMAGETTDHVVHIDLGAALPEKLEDRIPLNISLVLDHSGSMSGEQMDDARRAVVDILKSLDDEDHVSVIAFSTRVALLQEQSEWDDVDKPELMAKLGELGPMGTTAMQEALSQAMGQVRSKYDQGKINRIILLSDGIPNDATNLRGMAQQAQNSGIGISTFGLGPYYNEDLMAELADLSGGNYRFIETSDQIEEFFLAEKRSMEQIVARNVNLQIHLGPGVEVTQTLGGQASLGGRLATIYIGDFGASDTRQIALRLKVTAPASGASVELIDAHMTWEDVVNWSGNAERWAYLQATSTRDQALIDKNQNKLVVEKAGRLQAAWEMEQAIRQYEAGLQKEAEDRMRRAAQEYRKKREDAEAFYNFDDAVIDGELAAPQAGSIQSLDSYMEEAADELSEEEADSDKGKVLIKRSKSKSRSTSGK